MATVILEEIQLETNQTQKLRPFGLCAGEFRVPDALMPRCQKRLSSSLRANEALAGYTHLPYCSRERWRLNCLQN